MSNSQREKLHESQNNPNSIKIDILSNNASIYQMPRMLSKERLCIYKDYVRVTLSHFKNRGSPPDLLYLVIQFHIQFTKKNIWWKTPMHCEDIIPSVSHGRKFIPFSNKIEYTENYGEVELALILCINHVPSCSVIEGSS